MKARRPKIMFTFCTLSVIDLQIVLILAVTSSSNSLRIGTLNLWNVMFNWEERLQHMVSIIKEKKIDIAAFQEVRFSTEAATGWKSSQLEKAKVYLSEHKWLLAKPAGPAERPNYVSWEGWTEEGLALLSNMPIENFTVINFARHEGRDKNPRIALHAQIRVNPQAHGIVNVIVIHFSYERRQQCENSEDVLNFIADEDLKNVIVAGDFNAYPDFTGPVDVFTSRVSKACPFYRPRVDLLKDVMLQNMDPNQAPLTFSNMPNPGFVSRPDRILVSPSIKVTSSHLSGQGDLYTAQFYTAIIVSRAKAVLRSAFHSCIGETGYPCLHDCGPHGSCRCGVCVKGGDQLNCHLPNCVECSCKQFFIIMFIFCLVVLNAFILLFYIVKALIISSKIDQNDLFDIMGYRCCLFNYRLFHFHSFSRRLRFHKRKISILFKMPPFPMIVISLAVMAVLNIAFFLFCWATVELVLAILPEELFPSDHLMVWTEVELSK